MQTSDGRPIEVALNQDCYLVFANGRKVLALPHGSAKDLASAIRAGSLGTLYNVAAADDGRPVHITYAAGPDEPVVITVASRKVLKASRATMDELAKNLDESGPGEDYSAARVAAPESTVSSNSSAGPPLPADQGAGTAGVGKAPSATQRDESSVSTEPVPAPAPRVDLMADLRASLGLAGASKVAAYVPRDLEEVPLYDKAFYGVSEGLDLSTLDTNDFALPEYRQVRSWSQLTDYEECGWCYKRKRIDKVEELPAWWNVGGTAVHAAIEAFELSEEREAGRDPAAYLIQQFTKQFADGIAEMEAESGVQRSEWRAAKKGQEDEVWWWSAGMNMLRSYAQDYANRTWTVEDMETWVYGEIGGVNVQGYVDRVDDDHRGIWLTDMKSGQAPKDIGQLVTYVLLYEKQTGSEVYGARYHLTREGRFTEFRRDELEPYFEAMAYRYSQFDKAEYAGLYLPRLSGYGHRCSFYYDMELEADTNA